MYEQIFNRRRGYGFDFDRANIHITLKLTTNHTRRQSWSIKVEHSVDLIGVLHRKRLCSTHTLNEGRTSYINTQRCIIIDVLGILRGMSPVKIKFSPGGPGVNRNGTGRPITCSCIPHMLFAHNFFDGGHMEHALAGSRHRHRLTSALLISVFFAFHVNQPP